MFSSERGCVRFSHRSTVGVLQSEADMMHYSQKSVCKEPGLMISGWQIRFRLQRYTESEGKLEGFKVMRRGLEGTILLLEASSRSGRKRSRWVLAGCSWSSRAADCLTPISLTRAAAPATVSSVGTHKFSLWAIHMLVVSRFIYSFRTRATCSNIRKRQPDKGSLIGADYRLKTSNLTTSSSLCTLSAAREWRAVMAGVASIQNGSFKLKKKKKKCYLLTTSLPSICGFISSGFQHSWG